MRNVIVVSLFLAVLFVAAPMTNAAPLVFGVYLSGSGLFPPNGSPGAGAGLITIDSTAHTLRLQVTFSGLSSGTTESRFDLTNLTELGGHATAPFAGFPLGVTSGTYDMTFNTLDAAFYDPRFLSFAGDSAHAEILLFQWIRIPNRAYLNIYTANFPLGEIRGFPVPTPEPTTMLLLSTGLAGIAAMSKRRRKEP